MARRVLIIGNGAAGLSCAETFRSLDPSARILILTDEPHPFYSRPGIAYLLTGAIPENQLFARTLDEYRRLGIGLAYGRAIRLVPDRHEVRLNDGRRMNYDTLLLATGSRAVLPDIPGTDLKGVVTFDTLEDARRLIRMAKSARRAVVVGGGITAVELAEGLASRGVETHCFLRKDRYWGQVLDPDESSLVEEGLATHGIVLHRYTVLDRVIGRRGRVDAVTTKSGLVLPCQIVAFAVGLRPRLELAQATGIATDRGILVDEYFRTSKPDIFAAGDVAQVYDPRTGEHQLNSLWSSAIEQGRAAGVNLAGQAKPHERGVPFNVTCVGGVVTTIIGSVGQEGGGDQDLISIVRGDSETWRAQPEGLTVQSGASPHRLRILLGDQHIIGAVVMGDQRYSRMLQALIRGAYDIRPVRQDLLRAPQRAVEILASAIHIPEPALAPQRT
jgi:NAD(P)H-nitrite reductase large subunit